MYMCLYIYIYVYMHLECRESDAICGVKHDLAFMIVVDSFKNNIEFRVSSLTSTHGLACRHILN